MQRRIITLDEATPRQRQGASELQEGARVPGNLTRLMLGDGPWDIRIITEESTASGSRLWLTRAVDPSLATDTPEFNHLRLLFGWAAGHSPANTSGEFKGRLWYRRLYLPSVLADAPLPTDLQGALTLFRQLAELIEQYHAASLIHGHPSLSNVAVHADGTLALVDPGFALMCPSARIGRASLSPDIGSAGAANSATDLFTLGKVGRKLFPRLTLPDELAGLLEVLASSDSARRPSIHWVLGILRDLSADLSGAQPSSRSKRPTPRGSPMLRPSVSPSSEGEPPFEPPPPEPYQSAPELPQPQRTSTPWILIILIVFVAAAIISRILSTPKGPSIPSDHYWMSGTPSYMRAVAEAAIIQGDPEARLAIFDAARQGYQNPRVNSELLKVVLDSRWEEQLTEDDRTIILTLAVGSLLGQRPQLTFTEDVHPGVLYAIIARSPLDARSQELQHFQPHQLGTLPAPIGTTFTALQSLGITSIEDPASKGAAHFLSGDIRAPVIEAFFGPFADEGRLLAKLELIKDSLSTNEQLRITTLATLMSESPLVRMLMGWFDQDGLNTWKDVPPPTRFLISLGAVPAGLSYEQLIDLLVFTRPGVREAASRQILESSSFAAVHDILPVLSAPESGLSRMQLLSLAGALQTTGRDQLLLVHSWLKSLPPPPFVAKLLIARDGKGSKDGFNLEAARYLLKSKETQLPREMIIDLSTHSESMARAYAYGKLSAANEDDRRILQAALTTETSPRLKKQLAQTLK